MLVEHWRRKFPGLILRFTWTNENSHIGFEELAMRNIDAVLKEKQPLTPVNMHLMISAVKDKL